MLAWAAALVLLAIVAGNYALHRDAMHPAVLQSGVWATTVSLFASVQKSYIPVDLNVWILVVGGCLAFSWGCYRVTRDHVASRDRTHVARGSAPSRLVLGAGLLVSAVGVVLIAREASAIASLGPTFSLAMNLRLARTEGGFGPLSYLFPLIFAVTIATVVKYFGAERPPISKVQVFAILVIAATAGVLSTARGSLLFLVCAAAGVPLILRRFPVAWAAVGGFAILLVIFGGGAIFLLKGGDPTLSFGENLAAVVDSLVFYTVGSLPALGRVLSSSSDLEWGANSLRFLAALAHAVGFDVRVVSLVQDFTPVPQPINVYTMYHQYIRDFGAIGAIGAQACFGAAHGLLYRRATCRAPRALDVFVYSLALYPLFTQHFVDSYLSLLSTWLQYGLYGWIMFVWAKERRFSRERR